MFVGKEAKHLQEIELWVIVSDWSSCLLQHVEASFDKYEILFQIKWVLVACSLHNPQDVGFV